MTDYVNSVKEVCLKQISLLTNTSKKQEKTEKFLSVCIILLLITDAFDVIIS